MMKLVNTHNSRSDLTLIDFYREDCSDLFAKCRTFHSYIQELNKDGTYRSLYRLSLAGGLDHRILAVDPFSGKKVEMICYDSNSYLGLHLHPDVIAAVKKALNEVGFGTPSSPLLCGTNQYLRRLEETVVDFHKREDAMVFSSGYCANIGVISALLRSPDLVAADRFSHASIHDGARLSSSRQRLIYPHKDADGLDRLLTQKTKSGFDGGILIATDGVFSMHGTIAPLDKLRKIADKHQAILMVDDAHSTGVIGPGGFGTEDYYAMPGAADILVGTFSKAAGSAGGYVCGSRDVISYIRFFANSGLFTASLPAAACAGLAEAYRIMQKEPEHRLRLWRNINLLSALLRDAGLNLPERTESPILTIFMGSTARLRNFSRDLVFHRIKCGSVDYPAVPKGQSVIRLAVNSRHTREDIEQTADVFYKLAKKYKILNLTSDEIHETGTCIG